jgi:hypothetical protein
MERTWECKRCLHTASTKSNLLSHLRNKKTCKVDLNGGIDISIEQHIRVLLKPDDTPKKYSCQHCNRQFNTRQSKSRHLKTCRDKPSSSMSIPPDNTIQDHQPFDDDYGNITSDNDIDNNQISSKTSINCSDNERRIEELAKRVAVLEKLLAQNSTNNNCLQSSTTPCNTNICYVHNDNS